MSTKSLILLESLYLEGDEKLKTRIKVLQNTFQKIKEAFSKSWKEIGNDTYQRELVKVHIQYNPVPVWISRKLVGESGGSIVLTIKNEYTKGNKLNQIEYKINSNGVGKLLLNGDIFSEYNSQIIGQGAQDFLSLIKRELP